MGTLAKGRSRAISGDAMVAFIPRGVAKLRKAVPTFLAVIFCCALGEAQVAPYADAGIGVNGLSFQLPYYFGDVGVDWGNRGPIFVEGEVGADTANPTGLNNGTTFRAAGVVMGRVTQHWRLGGGFHFTELFTSQYDNHSVWPTAGAMFEQDWFRLNAQYLIPTTTDYSLNGPLFDMRMHLKQRFYFRERVGIYAYRNPNQVSPSHHVSAVADFGVLYVFR